MDLIDLVECIIDDCVRYPDARGLCSRHYQRFRRVRNSLSFEMFVNLGGPSPSEVVEMSEDYNVIKRPHDCPNCLCDPDEDEPDTFDDPTEGMSQDELEAFIRSRVKE